MEKQIEYDVLIGEDTAALVISLDEVEKITDVALNSKERAKVMKALLTKVKLNRKGAEAMARVYDWEEEEDAH